MSSKICIILVFLALLYSFGIHEALAQGQLPPLRPPIMAYGTAYVDGASPGSNYTVSIEMELLLVVFSDSPDDQTLIGNISTELANASGSTGPLPYLQDAFEQSTYCQDQVPPLLLSDDNNSVDPDGSDWQVIDWDNNSETYTVKILEPVPGGDRVLEVYQHNGLIASYDTATDPPIDYSPFNYSLMILLYSEEVLGEDGHVIREPGKATTGDKAYAHVNDIPANEVYIDDSPVTDVIIDGQTDIMKMDIYAPSLHQFDVELAAGGNQISFPLVLLDTNRDTILSTLGDSYDSVWLYDPSQPPGYKWLYYLRTAPEASSMGNTMQSSIGYWIEMSQSATLTIQGTPHTVATRVISLSAGGNLVGYNSQQSKLVVDCMASAGDNYDSVWVYDPTQPPGYKWLYYLRTAPGASSLEYVEPGMGLWIEANQAFDLDIGD